jgi:SAM-dependent methyltransferase
MKANFHFRKVTSFKEFSSPIFGTYRACPICQYSESTPFVSHNDFVFFEDSLDTPNAFTVTQCFCNNCHALFLNPCYSSDGFRVLFNKAGRSYGSSEIHQMKQLQWIQFKNLIGPGDTVLDVGCYEGNLLAKFPNDIKRIGVDIDKGAIERGAKAHINTNIKLIYENFEIFKLDRKPDLITMYHVLEHLPNPLETLKNLKLNSNDNTRLLIEVPILELGATNDINGFFSIQHQTHFSKLSLHRLMNLAGWEIVDSYTSEDYNGYGILTKIANDFPNDPIENVHSDKLLLWEYLSSHYKQLAMIQNKIKVIPKSLGIIIWGAGIHTELLHRSTSLFCIKNEHEFIIVDSDPAKHGSSWRGINIYDPQVLLSMNWDVNKIIISSYGSQNVIFEAAKKLGVPASSIICLYDKIRSY